MDRFITVAIHTYEQAISLRALLEREGIETQFRNVNIESPVIASGIRVRIKESDLPLALRIIENKEIFADPIAAPSSSQHAPIIVPVDFSSASAYATEVAFKIAESHGTGIVLLHAYIDPYVTENIQLTASGTYENVNASDRQQALASANTRMRHFASKVKDKIKSGTLPAVKFETCIVEGVPEDAITQYAKANNPFLIVMGTRSAKKKEMEMIGSVTAEVLDKCRYSVLALPDPGEGEKRFTPGNILFFSNAGQDDILALDTLHRAFPKANAKVKITSILGKKKSAAEQSLKALCEYSTQNFKGYTFFTAPHALEDIIERSSENGCGITGVDMLVVSNKRKNIFSRFFSPSLAHRVLFAADVPMLVIPV
ncbi:MAG: universal stress protein [Clostridium sp.]|nr:universal stress protein [Clostridium sp.]